MGIDGRMASVIASGRTGPRPHAFLLLLCLGAVLTGIIGMHLWMGGHGSHEDSVSAHSPASHSSQTAGAAATSGLPGLSGEHAPTGDGSPMPACVGTCDAGDMATGICVMSLIVLAMFVFLLPPRLMLRHALVRRGPPLPWRWFRFVPTPSLTQLCISRT